jgi:SNF2 family DNA or RNA helicase
MIIEDSIESRIIDLQEKKTRMIEVSLIMLQLPRPC